MKKQPTTFKPGALPRLFRARFIAALLPGILLLSIQSSFAGIAKWKSSPATGDWNTAGNWTAGGPPNGPADTATFASSNKTGVSISLNTEVNGIVFNAGASAFTITASPAFTLTISGVGITNNSGIMQNFVVSTNFASIGLIAFTNSATAGSLTAFTNNGSAFIDAPGGFVLFNDTSTAGNGTFTTNGGTVSGAFAGSTEFFFSSTAANGTFTNNAGTVSGAYGGSTEFLGSSTADNGTFTNNGGVSVGHTASVTALLRRMAPLSTTAAQSAAQAAASRYSPRPQATPP
jgi:hypothetical protein